MKDFKFIKSLTRSAYNLDVMEKSVPFFLKTLALYSQDFTEEEFQSIMETLQFNLLKPIEAIPKSKEDFIKEDEVLEACIQQKLLFYNIFN